MTRAALLALAFGAAPLVAVAAQPVSPPPVVSNPPPVPVPASPSADPHAQFVKASGTLDLAGEIHLVDLLIDGDQAVLRLTGGQSPIRKVSPLTTPNHVLYLLANRQAAFLWPALTEWAGPSLERIRSTLIAGSKRGFDARHAVNSPRGTGESTVRPAARAVVQYARTLDRTGDSVAAVEILRRAAGALDLEKSWGRTEYSVLWSEMASILHDRGQSTKALAELSAGLRTLGDSRYANNLAINRAAILVESGRYEEGLEAVTKVREAFSRSGGDRVAGSERAFAWIRACALQGLGRAAEAKRALPDLLTSADPVDESFIVPTNQVVSLRALQCMGDAEGLVQVLLADLAKKPLLPLAMLFLQPGRPPPVHAGSVWEKVRADPRIIAATRDRLRLLPPELAPALRAWQPAPLIKAAT